MSLGQTMLSAGALVLLTVMVINAHRMIVYSADDARVADAIQVGVDIAQSLIDEISQKMYDENYDPTKSQGTKEFTASSSLGPDAGESFLLPDVEAPSFKSIGSYDDVDDYQGYQRTVDKGGFAAFQVSIQVFYVQDADPEVATTSKTYTKKAVLTISHETYSTPITFTTILTYASSGGGGGGPVL